MTVNTASLQITAGYNSSGIANTGGTVTDAFSDATNINAQPNATKTWSYLADAGVHNASLASSSSVTFTLSALTGALGSVAFSNILVIYFRNLSTTDSVTLGGAATHPWGPLATGITIPPGGIYALAAPATGWSVTAGVADQIKVATGVVSNPVPFALELHGN
jgi:hypothetical protein